MASIAAPIALPSLHEDRRRPTEASGARVLGLASHLVGSAETRGICLLMDGAVCTDD